MATCGRYRTAVIVPEQGAILGMGAVLNDKGNFFPRIQSPEIGNSLIGNDHMHFMLRMIHVGDMRYDTGDRLSLLRRWRHHNDETGAAGKISRSSNTVYHGRAHDMG